MNSAITGGVHIIGGGLAGVEAAWQLARRGIPVRLSEMRGTGERSPAHQGDGLAELVCSNSFRSDDDQSNAVGLLHHEMRACGSLVMAAAATARVPAGSALAVDRDVFSAEIERALAAQPTLAIVRERIDQLPADGLAIVATGPLTAACSGRQHRRGDGRGGVGLLRRHRADRPCRQHRPGRRLAPVALG